MPLDLIIFDNDGTLSDSELINNIAVSALLMGYGLSEYTPDYCHKYLAGKAMSDIKAMIEQKHGVVLPDDFIARFIQDAREATKRELHPVPGAVEAVLDLAQRYKTCVASNGERENVLTAIEAIGLMPHFTEQKVFTKIQVPRGKPFPDLFLFAAKQMGAEAENCLVIEDTETGVKAAKAARMRVVGITAVAHDRAHMTEALEEAGAEYTGASWSEVLYYIKTAVDK